VKDDRTFGQRLRETRVGAGMSQSDLEEISGIPKARLSRYENGHVAPSIQTLERLSKALKVSEASLLGDQRAMLEAFFAVLYDRGVRITSNEQAALLGNAVADIAQAIGLEVERSEPDAEPPQRAEPTRGSESTHGGEPTLSMATLSEWLAPGP
jgi:transcriptional regulator with XRE-family HTH domain